MRVIVLFDVPMETSEQIREYTSFRKGLIKEGFVMLQKSIYTKIALNQTSVTAIKDRVNKIKPKFGIVQMLSITEKQFNSIECIVGSVASNTINSDKKVILL